MRTGLFLPGLLYVFLAPAPFASAATLDEHSSAAAVVQHSSVKGQEGGQGEMASTALDFKEMMRKERELAMKKRAPDTTTTTARYC